MIPHLDVLVNYENTTALNAAVPKRLAISYTEKLCDFPENVCCRISSSNKKQASAQILSVGTAQQRSVSRRYWTQPSKVFGFCVKNTKSIFLSLLKSTI